MLVNAQPAPSKANIRRCEGPISQLEPFPIVGGIKLKPNVEFAGCGIGEAVRVKYSMCGAKGPHEVISMEVL